MTPRHLIRLLPIVCALGLVSAPAWAQGGPQEKRAEVESRIKQIRARVLRQEVGLTEEKARKVEAIMDRFQAERRPLREKIRAHRQAIARLLQADSNDQAAYSREIAGLRDAHRKLQASREHELDELQRILSPKEQAKTAAAVQKMRRKIREAVAARGEDVDVD